MQLVIFTILFTLSIITTVFPFIIIILSMDLGVRIRDRAFNTMLGAVASLPIVIINYTLWQELGLI